MDQDKLKEKVMVATNKLIVMLENIEDEEFVDDVINKVVGAELFDLEMC